MNKNKKIKQKKACPPTRRGSALIFATIILFSLLAITVTLSAITVQDMKMSQKTKSSTGAFFNADSGVEWALYKIATSNATSTINTTFSTTAPGNGVKPSGVTDYKVYLLDKDGKVITTNLTVDQIKAVRSVGTQGGETQRSIEAAVPISAVTTTATGNYISTPSSTDFDFGNGDFTIDFWFNPSNAFSGSNSFNVAEYDNNGSSYWRLYFAPGISGIVLLMYSNNVMGAYCWLSNIDSSFTPGSWHHLAIERNGSSCLAFLDGTSRTTSLHSPFTDMAPIGGTLKVGGNTTSLRGYIDELRISKGIARWTTPSFTLPSSAYSSDGNTKLLLHADGSGSSFIDSSSSNHPLTPNGSATQTTPSKFGSGSADVD